MRSQGSTTGVTSTRISGTLIERSNRRNRPLSVLITDIDHFKAINDVHGHEGGDDVLKDFARRVRGAVRGADLACRYGGEEFVVIMPDTTLDVAAQVAERLRDAIATAPFKVCRQRCPCSFDNVCRRIATLEAERRRCRFTSAPRRSGTLPEPRMQRS
jgi:diguanylate cyclase (GGDEF)-like protein